MKINKSILFVGLAMVTLIMGVTSCSASTEETDKKSENKTENKDNIEYSAESDSLATAIGAGMGGSVNNQIKTITDSAYLAKLSKEEMVKALNYVLAIDSTNEGHIAGLGIGLQLIQQLQYFEKEGVKINRKLVIEQFEKALMQDSVPMTEIFAHRTFIQTTEGKILQEKESKRLEALEKSPEAIQGTKTGEAFINKKKQENPEIKTTASGLSYKIIYEGEGAKVSANDYVKVIYKGSLIDGTVFDDSKGEARGFNVSGVVPGFAEGLQLLGKGGKAILYIPGKLGYGVQGQSYAGIGPNQTLVFEVEIVEIVEIAEITNQNKPVGMKGEVVK